MSVVGDLTTSIAELPMPVKIGLIGAAGVVAFVALRARSADAAAGPNQDAFGLGGASPSPNNMYTGGSGQAGQTGGGGNALAEAQGLMDSQLNYLARSQELAASALAKTNELELSKRRQESLLAREDADYQFGLSKAVSAAQAEDLKRRGLIGIDLASQQRQREGADAIQARIADFDFLFGTGDTSATNNRPSVGQRLGAGRTVTKRIPNPEKKSFWDGKPFEIEVSETQAFDSAPGAGTSRFDTLLRANQSTFDQQLRQQVQSNNAALDYQKKLIDASKPKQKKFLGIIGGDVGKFLNGAAEIAAPILTAGQVQYNSYAPGSPVQINPAAGQVPGFGGNVATPGINPGAPAPGVQYGNVTGAGNSYLQELLARALKQAPRQAAPENVTPPAGQTGSSGSTYSAPTFNYSFGLLA